MEFSLTNTDCGLRYDEQGSTTLWRVLFAAVGITAITSSYVFIEIIKQFGQIEGAAKVGSLVAAILGIVAFCLFGAYCLKIALTLPTQSVLFHRDRRQITYIARSPAFGARETNCSFESIKRMEVMEHCSDNGETTFTVAIKIPGAKLIPKGVFADRGQASDCLTLIQQAVGNAP